MDRFNFIAIQNNIVFSVAVLSLNETEQEEFLNIFQQFPPPTRGENFVTFYSENCTVSDDPLKHVRKSQ